MRLPSRRRSFRRPALGALTDRRTALPLGQFLRSTDADESVRDDVAFPIGTVFRHRKYGYRAVIVGHDATCQAGERWQRLNHVAIVDQVRPAPCRLPADARFHPTLPTPHPPFCPTTAIL